MIPNKPLVLASFAAAGLLAGVARAQVSVDPRALDALRPPSASPAPAKPPTATAPSPSRPPARSQGRAPRPSTQASPRAAFPAAGRGSGARPPVAVNREPYGPPASAAPPKHAATVVPTTPPANPNLPPPIAVPVRPVPPPAPPPVTAGAEGRAIQQPDGLRVTFGGGSADLNPRTEEALRALAHEAPPFDTTTFVVTAYAAGNAEDPSTPRRLALSRALAVRSVLIGEKVASTRIFVKAMGASGPDFAAGVPDRVDVAVVTPRPPEPAPPSASASPAPPAAAPSPPAPTPTAPAPSARRPTR